METETGKVNELYIPRKCSSSSRIVSCRDHSSVQIDFVDVDPQSGRMLPTGAKRYTICGALRRMGESDDCINRLAIKDGLLPHNKQNPAAQV